MQIYSGNRDNKNPQKESDGSKIFINNLTLFRTVRGNLPSNLPVIKVEQKKVLKSYFGILSDFSSEKIFSFHHEQSTSYSPSYRNSGWSLRRARRCPASRW